MGTTIKLLPKNVINQIAAGEVIQRPSSVVKELIDNSIDAKATRIHLIIKEAGKSLIQVIDNGIGMDNYDAKTCFERHTTSKISKTEDIFKIHTLGFRGEGLASMASVSKIILKTKKEKKETGTKIVVDQGKLISSEEIIFSNGTSIEVKNLFFNIPARKVFLKSNKVETKHIIDEFFRAAISKPSINFKITSDEKILYDLKSGNLKQRLCSIFGKNFEEKIVPIEEKTQVVDIYGYLGKPSFARKTRGEQYFFVNNRFIKSAYLNHAISNSVEGLLKQKMYLSYFIFFEIDTTRIDVNVHPTKTEIKFDDEKIIYSILSASCRRSIGKFNILPSIDFETENSFELPSYKPKNIIEPKIKFNSNYNPFKSNLKTDNTNNWENLFNIDKSELKEEILIKINNIFQIQNNYIICSINNSESGVSTYIISQQKAHQRIIFENQIKALKNENIVNQVLISPISIDLSASDIHLLEENKKIFFEIGYDFKIKNNTQVEIMSTPSSIVSKEPKEQIESFLEEIKNNNININLKEHEKIARSVAYSTCMKKNRLLSEKEMLQLIRSLFKCESPFISLDGSPCAVLFEPKQIFEYASK